MADRFWMIVNASESVKFEPRKPSADWLDFELRWDCKPGYAHGKKENAEKELIRLSERNPNCDFVLLEAIAVAKRSNIVRKLITIEPIEE